MRLRKQVYIYFATYFINAGLFFLIVSLLTHHLSTYDYGIINLYSSFLVLLMPFVSAGILYPLSVEYFKKTHEEYRTYFSNSIALSLLSFLLFTILCVVFQQPLSKFLKVPVFWIWIMPLIAWWIMINETSMIITRNRNQPFRFALFSVGKTVIEIGLTLLLVLVFYWTWDGRLAAAAAAPAILGILSLYLFYRWDLIEKNISRAQITQIFLLSLPFVFERLSIFVLSNADRYFIDKYDQNGTAEVGLYGVAGQIASVVYILMASMNSAYHPYIYQRMKDGLEGKIHRVTWMYIAACAVVIGMLFLGVPLLFRWFIGDDFRSAQKYVYILGGGYFMWGVYNALLPYLIYLRKNRQVMYISVVGMIASLAANFILVPDLGARGAAFTSVITYTIMAILSIVLIRKYYLVPLPVRGQKTEI